MTRRAFSLIELLVTMGVIGVLLSVLLPTLGSAREAGRGTVCLAHLRQLGAAWTLYANDYADRAMPLAYWSAADIGSGEQVFWWGTHGTAATPVDHSRGFIAPYLDAGLAARSVFECPAQPWGTYTAQGPRREPTSTYGYNGYYLSPLKTPGWAASIGHRPWRRLYEITTPTTLAVFADAMLPGEPMRNSALLDPPQLWFGGWAENPSPTTCFRHGASRARAGSASVAAADGSARAYRALPEWIVDGVVGSVGADNAPHYVPDAAEWR